MILGIGVDIVRLSRIEKLLFRYKDRFIRKILHPSERSTFQSLQDPRRKTQFISGRWAAKEAAFKAFGQTRPRILFPEICVSRNGNGTLSLKFTGAAQIVANERSVAVRLLPLFYNFFSQAF
mmetsp:Transcript_13462/g.15339  ORF Transcript_13462/g.15339 Transcript_13462/m.15339 type:complete len:122 (+) Transcript_13462:32-397(+)